ncbi:hypothetical protein Dimus_037871 [Dionaea muscipula]
MSESIARLEGNQGVIKREILAEDSTAEEAGDDETLAVLKTKKRRLVRVADPVAAKKIRADIGSDVRAVDIVTSEDPILDEVLHNPFLSRDTASGEFNDQLEDDNIDRMGFAPKLPTEIEREVQVDVQTNKQITAEAEDSSDGEEGGLSDVSQRATSKRRCRGVMDQARMDAPSEKMKQLYADFLLGTSSSSLKGQLDKIKREEEFALMRRNLAELSAMFGHAMARDKEAFKSREETRCLYQESLKENKRLMEELAMKDSALTSREADLAKMAELNNAEEKRRSNLETVLETTRREKERMEALLDQEKKKIEDLLEKEKKRRE